MYGTLQTQIPRVVGKSRQPDLWRGTGFIYMLYCVEREASLLAPVQRLAFVKCKPSQLKTPYINGFWFKVAPSVQTNICLV